MPQGAAFSEQSSGENITHFAAIRIRLVGTGSLKMKVYSLDDVRSKTVSSIHYGYCESNYSY